MNITFYVYEIRDLLEPTSHTRVFIRNVRQDYCHKLLFNKTVDVENATLVDLFSHAEKLIQLNGLFYDYHLMPNNSILLLPHNKKVWLQEDVAKYGIVV